MRGIQRKKWAAALAVIVCFLTICVPVAASQSQIDETRDEINRLQQQKDQAGGRLDALKQDEAYLDGRIKELNSQLSALAEELTGLEQQIMETEQSIEDNEILLTQAKETEQRQYEDMKLRIRFLYERGETAMLEELLSAKSIADFLNFGEYVESIHAYDRRMLEEYRRTRQEIADTEAMLVAEREALVEERKQQEQKQQEAQNVLAQVQDSLSDTQSQISAAQSEMADYEDQIRKQMAYEEELERQKAAEEAKRLEEQRQQEEQKRQEEQLPPLSVEGTADEEAMLAALIECEAGGESYEGKLAVGSVVLNRVRSSRYPNTVMGVIYQRGQFSPVASGRFATVLARGADSQCRQAAQEVLGGNLTLDCLYFRVNTGAISGIVIGNHVFY